ncbi:MAG TPA: type II toxin-antitoxin system VapC family toxin [Tangfeifania sp.]|nr:type II toxin-antitoxin system VapC family toxin [Tangfeifania sp.]
MVVDTSIFIEFLRKKNKTETVLFSLPENVQLAISSITLYELLMGATNKSKKEDIMLLTEDLLVLPFDRKVAEKSGEIYHQLRKENNMIEFRDIFIAATCLVYQMPVKTLNQKHFKRIANLEIA